MSAPADAFAPKVGDPVAAIDTPALVIDLDAMERNLARHGRLRPRPQACASGRTRRCTSARRSPGCSARPARSGVRAEDERGRGPGGGRRRRHLHLQRGDRSRQAGPRRRAWRRGCGWRSPSTRSKASSGWRRRCARPARAIDVFVEVDVGHGRCGAPAAAAGALAHRVVAHAPPDGGLRFAGLQAYHGAAQHLRGASGAGGGVAPRRVAGERGPRRHHRRRHRLPAGHRRRHRHLRLRRRQRRLGRAAGRQLPVHGSRLRRQRAGAEHAALRARALRQEPGDEPRRRRTRWSMPDTSRMRSIRGCRASGSARWRIANGGDEHGILRAGCGRRAGRAAAARRDGLAGAGSLRPDRQPARRAMWRCAAGSTAGVVEAVWAIEARGCVA